MLRTDFENIWFLGKKSDHSSLLFKKALLNTFLARRKNLHRKLKISSQDMNIFCYRYRYSTPEVPMAGKRFFREGK
jgi:hypothetical protein